MKKTNTITEIKIAHKYNLKVKWSKRAEWDINILSISAEAISMWLPKEETEEDYIMNVNIQLLEKNVEKVKCSFLAKVIY
jgi:argininosuccinate synthase